MKNEMKEKMGENRDEVKSEDDNLDVISQHNTFSEIPSSYCY